MLILSRRKEEKIVVAGNIIITIVSVNGNTVKLGIEAPKEVSVNREEVEQQKKGKAA